MLSNSNPKNTNKEDTFFDNIYQGFNIDEIYASRMINANSKGKKQEFETLLMYYWLNDIVGDDDNYWNEYLNKVSK